MGRCKKNFKVVEYTLQGELVEIYDSAKSASIKKHTHPRTIDKCIRGDSLSAKSRLWRRHQEDDIPLRIDPYIKNSNKTTPVKVATIDVNGNIIKIYPSIKNASKELGIDPHSIRDNIKGKTKQTKGYRFKVQ